PAGSGRGGRPRCAVSQGIPRGALPRGLRHARRRELPAPHDGLPHPGGRGGLRGHLHPPGDQAGRHHPLRAEGAHVLMTAVADKTPAPEAGAEEVPSFDVTLRIARFNPESEQGTYWEDFTVTMHGTDRVLDAMHEIKWHLDGSLTFRRSCAHGICGSDAMRINGRNRLACKTLLKDLDISKPITVEPIKGLPVEKDLIVDMEPFFDSYKEIMPFLVASGQEPSRERLQSAEQRERFDDTT